MYLKLAADSKKPVRGDWQLSPEPWEGANNGLTLENRTVVDYDVLSEARTFWKRYRDLCTFAVRTPKGVHFHFTGETRARKFEHGDIKSGPHAYVVMPPSTVDGKKYEFICQGELQPFPEQLFPDTRKEIRRTSREIRNVARYVMAIESRQGEHGSHGLVRAAAVARDCGLSESEATILLLQWNQTPAVSPPWEPEDIARAITRTYAKEKA
ncbi:MAG TPA: bifunctional DNA primase/polymerase [Pirellulaceae bacterium]|jgi:hypothetical protein|nr:bifunctional DNA primase/polymerase [Pirellulaceae bacterium]